MQIDGKVASGFEPVADAFAANFESGDEVGAACAVYVDGEEVVDIRAGLADPESGRPWDESTLALVHSTTKGVAAVCAALLVQRGDLDIDRPVADYWPEFAANGKDRLPVRMLLNHQAGLPVVDRPLTMDDVFAGTPVVEALAEQRPVWEPGTRHGYHAVTYGTLVGEVVRRITGRTLGRFFADEIAGPLGLDFWIGLPRDEHHRVAAFVYPEEGETPPEGERAAAFADPNGIPIRAATMNGALLDVDHDDEFYAKWYSAEMPAANGIGNARAIARLYAACVSEVDGIRLLDDDTVALATTEQSCGPDAVILTDTRYGLGFWLPTPTNPMLGPTSFGHPGSGGSVGLADVEARVGFGYVMNRMGTIPMGDPRKYTLLQALERCLG